MLQTYNVQLDYYIYKFFVQGLLSQTAFFFFFFIVQYTLIVDQKKKKYTLIFVYLFKFENVHSCWNNMMHFGSEFWRTNSVYHTITTRYLMQEKKWHKIFALMRMQNNEHDSKGRAKPRICIRRNFFIYNLLIL